jgi:hypothetical protein
MQYFVSAENSSYFYWQLELLIESFLMQGMEKDLVIGLAENDAQKIRGYSSNLVKYGNKFVHTNEGKKLDYLPINRVNAIRYALAYKMLEFPFVLIHADMLLKNPIKLQEEDSEFGIIINNYEDTSEAEKNAIKQAIEPDLKQLAKDREVEFESLPTLPALSAPIVFNKPFEYVADAFFSKLQINLLNILEKRGKNFPCERAAWEQTLIESFQHCSIKGNFMAAPLLYEEENINFIHYKTGIPPVFNKKFYKFEHGTFFNGQGPYETILEHNPTVNSNYMHQIIRSYNRRNNK